MIRTGDSIANPVTGETVTFQRTSADSGGELVIAEVTLEPGGSAATVHVHPNQTETFQILDGTVGFRLGRERLFATAGDTVTVKAGTAHTSWEHRRRPGPVCMRDTTCAGFRTPARDDVRARAGRQDRPPGDAASASLGGNRRPPPRRPSASDRPFIRAAAGGEGRRSRGMGTCRGRAHL